MTTRIHNSKMEIPRILPVAWPDEPEPLIKPIGLWYGVDGGWQERCAADFPEHIHAFNYSVDASRANVLLLDSIPKMLEFERKFFNNDSPLNKTFPATHDFHPLEIDCYAINWRAVAAEYDGIEIAPYHWPMRMARMWYYSWDCASGCVWNTEKISIGLINPPLDVQR
jgi:hypothetical protein